MSANLSDHPAAAAAWLNDQPPATADSGGGARRFAARSLREAYAQVRVALGPDALILEQRNTAQGVEVVASLEQPVRRTATPARDGLVARLRNHGYGSAVLARLPSLVRGVADVERALGRLVPCTPPPQPLCGRFRLLGPTGAGKTTALIKLMAARVLRYGSRGMVVIGTDRSRLAGCEQLASSAELLGVEYVECSEAELAATLEHCRHMQLVLIDAPGLRGTELPAPVADVQDLLTVPAMWQGGALRRLRQRLAAHPLSGVVLTHTDQAESLCECANALAEWQLPVWWIGHGGEVAAELDGADEQTLGRALLGEFDRCAVGAMFQE